MDSGNTLRCSSPGTILGPRNWTPIVISIIALHPERLEQMMLVGRREETWLDSYTILSLLQFPYTFVCPDCEIFASPSGALEGFTQSSRSNISFR
jgi:hypothetical protein